MENERRTHSQDGTPRARTASTEISGTSIDYRDTGGDGPVVVLLHGLLMDSSLWDGVLEHLGDGHRCVVPTLPMGAHRHAAGTQTELTVPGLSRLVTAFLDALDLHEVTLVGVDTGGALVQIIAARHAARVARIVLAPSDAFDNFPPGLTGRTLVRLGGLPPALFGLAMQPLRLRPLRRSPWAFGWLTRRGDAVSAHWLAPILTQAAIRRDTVRLLRSIAAQPGLLTETAAGLSRFTRPALIVWTPEDRVMPPAHGRRLAHVLPHARLVEITDSLTLIPLDQPERLAQTIAGFIDDAAAAHRRRESGHATGKLGLRCD